MTSSWFPTSKALLNRLSSHGWWKSFAAFMTLTAPANVRKADAVFADNFE